MADTNSSRTLRCYCWVACSCCWRIRNGYVVPTGGGYDQNNLVGPKSRRGIWTDTIMGSLLYRDCSRHQDDLAIEILGADFACENGPPPCSNFRSFATESQRCNAPFNFGFPLSETHLCLMERSVRWELQVCLTPDTVEPPVLLAECLSGQTVDHRQHNLARLPAMPFVAPFVFQRAQIGLVYQ